MDNPTRPTKIAQTVELTAPEWAALQQAAGSLQSGTCGSEPMTPSAAILALIGHVRDSLTQPDAKADNEILQVTSEDTVTIYTDGACSGNPGPGGWGAVVLMERDGGEPANHELSGGDRDTTNNKMELTAVIKALDALPSGSSATVITDNTYVKDGATDWMATWKRNGWKTADRKPVKNRDLWTLLDALQETRKITWRWVKGHAGNEFNERADVLAQLAIPRMTSHG
jgi:ribonuclease HI